MMDVDEKVMAYCLIEALFAALVEDSARAFLFIRKSKKMEVKTCE